MRDQIVEPYPRLHPFFQNSAAIEVDAIGHRHRLAPRLLPDRQAAVETGQVERMLDTERGERFVVGEFLDQQHDRAQMLREGGRQAIDRRAGDRFDRGGVGRGAEGVLPIHRPSHRRRRPIRARWRGE